jgi:hypothetical protein
MPTTLAFYKRLRPEDGNDIGTVDVRDFAQIRVSAYLHRDSSSGVGIHLSAEEANDESPELDFLPLEPASEITRVYDVPGTTLRLRLGGPGSFSEGAGSVFVWGRT